MPFKTTIIALAIAVLPGFAFAQATPATPATPSDKAGARIDQRQANQQQRIDAGVKSGELNKREAARMEKGQARVQTMEDKARASSRLILPSACALSSMR